MLPFIWHKNVGSFFRLVIIHAFDRRTDCSSQDLAACSWSAVAVNIKECAKLVKTEPQRTAHMCTQVHDCRIIQQRQSSQLGCFHWNGTRAQVKMWQYNLYYVIQRASFITLLLLNLLCHQAHLFQCKRTRDCNSISIVISHVTQHTPCLSLLTLSIHI